MSNSKKLQYLLIKQLLKEGNVELLLPCGTTLEIGITQEDKSGNQVKTDDYCSVSVKQDGRSVFIDSYNLGLKFIEDQESMIFEDVEFDDYGRKIHWLDVN